MTDPAVALRAKLAVLKEFGLHDRIAEIDGVKIFPCLPAPRESSARDAYEEQAKRENAQQANEERIALGATGGIRPRRDPNPFAPSQVDLEKQAAAKIRQERLAAKAKR